MVNALQTALVQQVAENGGKAVTHAYDVKIKKYQERCSRGGLKFANVVIQVIYITCSWQVFVYPILQSPHGVTLIFRTCQLHTAWELLNENGGSERQAAWHGRLD